MVKKEKGAWNKGLTKEDPRVKKYCESRKGYRHSEETKKHWSETRKGKSLSEETKAKLKGRTPWNKGNKGLYKTTAETKEKMRIANTGKKRSEETKRKLSEIKKGKNSGFWKGGVSKINNLIRAMPEYKFWRSKIYERDNWTCQTCKLRGLDTIQAHHKKQLEIIIKENNIKTIEDAKKCDELWDLDNGITLCEECHKLTDSYLKRVI